MQFLLLISPTNTGEGAIKPASSAGKIGPAYLSDPIQTWQKLAAQILFLNEKVGFE